MAAADPSGAGGLSGRVERLRALVRQARGDLFNQSSPIGRLSLVQVAMLAGDTLVTISLAGTLFFSITPTAAKGKVFLYLLFTLAPFAVVAPFLGPLIDRSRGARRTMVVFSALGRAALCPLMAMHVHSLLLFPMAFCVLVLSKLYLVTRGALVPEMAAASVPDDPAAAASPPSYATLNARLTLLGTLAGFVVGVPGGAIWKLAGSSALLWCDAFIFLGAAVAGARLPATPRRRTRVTAARDMRADDMSRDLAELAPVAGPDVLLGLSAMSIIRGIQGFQIFLLAFGLRRAHAGLGTYGLALAAAGAGALGGLMLLPLLRRHRGEARLITAALWLIAVSAAVAADWGSLAAQVLLALLVGLAGAVAQPCFDAMAQRAIRPAAQGRAFARFATRQQLVWVLGAMVPVVIALSLPTGDVVMAVVAAVAAVSYMTGRRSLRTAARRERDGDADAGAPPETS